MGEITVCLPTGARATFTAGSSIAEMLQTLDPVLAREAVAARLDGSLVDLSRVPENNAVLEVVSLGSPEGLEVLRHSTAHLMAAAVARLFPSAKFGIGPAIEDGFYYDFDLNEPISDTDLTRIEEVMQALVAQDISFQRKVLSRDKAKELFATQGEHLKLELLGEITEEEVSVYQLGDFVDLCRGPHLPSTGKIRAFKLLSVAGAYWRGSEKNKMLQRLYGTAFPSKEALEAYLFKLEEARRRDHRRLGRELDLYSVQEEAGPGLILWHPKGALVRRLIEDFWKDEHHRAGYQLLYTPHIARLDVWRQSGHWEFYRENMFAPMEVEGIDYELKPMNCPFHILIYRSQTRSYRDLPIRWAELGTVYRFERSGVLHGLLRVRGFTQDDAHIFCRPDQLEGEIFGVLDLTLFILRAFGFEEYEIFLSTRPEKCVGSPANWELAEAALQQALEKRTLHYKVDPGEGVFYGPKIDVKIKDVLGRAWQCTTIQVDFNLPERFDLKYAGEDGKLHQPIMIHRAILGSLERFLGILIEHYAGALPAWLAPVQVRVLPVADRHHSYADEIYQELTRQGLRAEVDRRNEKVGFKVRQGEVEKVPFLLVVGDREVKERAVSVRARGGRDMGIQAVEAFLQLAKREAAVPAH